MRCHGHEFVNRLTSALARKADPPYCRGVGFRTFRVGCISVTQEGASCFAGSEGISLFHIAIGVASATTRSDGGMPVQAIETERKVVGSMAGLAVGATGCADAYFDRSLQYLHGGAS
jgi:hypothetical protein